MGTVYTEGTTEGRGVLNVLDLSGGSAERMAGVAWRFWSKVRVEGGDECWPWQAFRDPETGYGRFNPGHGKVWMAHRAAFLLSGRELREGAHVCHACDNRPCCNPLHLWAGTAQDNIRDMFAKGRGTQGNTSESTPSRKLSPEQVREIRGRSARFPLVELAREYGVSPSAIHSIVSGKTWRAAKYWPAEEGTA